jgi:hypothetical protein
MNHKIFDSEGKKYFGFTCPACKTNHLVPVVIGAPQPGAMWGWDGNEEKPTVTPSLRVFALDGQTTACHCNVTNGQIVYHGDSGHSLKGATIDLPEWHSVMEEE